MVIWLTGLSGVGKSTLGKALVASLRERQLFAVLVDGDEVRNVIADRTVGHDSSSRLVNAYRIARAARWLESQGCVAIVATMSLFHEIHAWNREHMEAYVEVFLVASRSALERRHPTNLYGRAATGIVENVVGHDVVPEVPLSPHLTLLNDNELESFSAFAEVVSERVELEHPGWQAVQKVRQCRP